MSNVQSPYARIDVIAKYFDVSTSTVRTWVTEGRIPNTAYIKSGRTYRFCLPEVEAALLAGQASATAAVTDDEDSQLSLDFGSAA